MNRFSQDEYDSDHEKLGSAILFNIVTWLIIFVLLWFLDDIMNLITPFLMFLVLIPMGLWLVGAFIANIVAGVGLRKQLEYQCLLPMLTFLILGWLVFSIPITSTKITVEHFFFQNARMEIVEKYHNGESFDVPNYLALDGKIKTETKADGSYYVGFRENSYILESCTIIYYTSVDDVNAIGTGGLDGYKITGVEKLSDHWYAVTFE